MKERLLAIMEHEGLTAAQFADAIGIQRSAVAHFLSGRNNPSMGVLNKILRRFTYIDANWLLLGEGNMMRKNVVLEPDLFSNTAVNPTKATVAPEYRKETRVETPVNTPKQIVKETIVIPEGPSRNVSKIVIFYSDGTFETLIPEKHGLGKNT